MIKTLLLALMLFLSPSQNPPHHDFPGGDVAKISGFVYAPSDVIEGSTNVTLTVELQPNQENYWLITVVTRKSDNWEMRHFGPVDPAFGSIPDLWPNMGKDSYEAYVILERVKQNKDGDVTEVDDYTSEHKTFQVK